MPPLFTGEDFGADQSSLLGTSIILEKMSPTGQYPGSGEQACCRESRMTVLTRLQPIPPTSKIIWCGAKDGRAVMHVVRPPVRPATR
jgi:hypothetical protein